jgi:serine/threonine protein kinase
VTLVGTTVGKYQIVSKIGQGAMGEVYKAHDSVLGRDVAIKTIAAELGSDDTLRKRFEREALAAAGLNHPNIITVFDFGEWQGKLYMAMELLEGEDLKTMFAAHRPAAIEARIDLMSQIADGLAFAHAHDVVHRDLKPANLHVQRNGQVKIMDFGLARLSGSEMTRTGMVIGTPHYMSPEQVRGERASARSDVFSIGCVFYELLTFHKAFDAPTMHSVLFKVMSEEPQPLQELAPEIPLALSQVVTTAIAKDPAARFPHAGELLSALQEARRAIGSGHGHEPLPSLPVPARAARPAHAEGPREASSSAAPRPRSAVSRAGVSHPAPHRSSAQPLVLGAAGVVGAVLVAALLLLFLRSRSSSGPPPATRPAQLDSLTQTLVETKLEVARKRLEADDFGEAAKAAELAVRLDPSREEAKRILERAQAVVAAADKAAEALRNAVAAGDEAGAAQAFWTLIQKMPDHAAAGEHGGRFEAAFGDRAREAQGLAAEARAAAVRAGGEANDRFQDGEASRRQAESDLKAGRFASAARRFLKARGRYERARG